MPYSLQGTIGAVFGSRNSVEFEWKVENFFSLSKVVDDCYHSPDFYFLGRSWYLRLYPNGETTNSSAEYVGLYVMLDDSCKAIEIQFTLGVLTVDGETIHKRGGILKFGQENRGFGLSKFIRLSELLKRPSDLMPSDVITFKAILTTTSSCPARGIVDVSVQTEDFIGRERGQPSSKTGCEKVSEDLGELLQSGDVCDVVVRVKDVEFKAHRSTLAARTPVFRAMFVHDTKEKASGVVTICDCEPETFEEFLHYIYTGAPQMLTVENASALFVVAEKYLADDLKTQCLLYIRDTLCVETVCDAIVLALEHGEAHLFDQATDFAARNIRAIIKSVKWQMFIIEHLETANEILMKALGPDLEEPRKTVKNC